MKNLILLFFMAIILGCATPQTAINPRADFTKIKRVAVISFDGPKGDIASDMMSQALVQYGADVVERKRLNAVLNELELSQKNLIEPQTAKKVGKLLGVDAIFMGSVIDLKPNTKYIVQTNSSNPQNTINPVSGKSIYSEGAVIGLNDAQILSTTAEVSMVAKLVEIETGSIIWSAYMSYEGFDIPAAMSSISNFFVKSLTPIWPELNRVH